MPTFYNYSDNGIIISLDDVLMPADPFREGNLWSWGRNDFGQLATNDALQYNSPTQRLGQGLNWRQVSAGYKHAAGVKTDGTLWTWGRNDFGQLGDNTATSRSTPVTTFAGGTNWREVACGGHTAAIKNDGTLWTWGRNNNGQVGDNSIIDRSTPITTFAGGTNWKEASCSGAHTAAIKTDGTLWVWGYNLYGQLGDNTSTSRSTPVTTFVGGTDWTKVSDGGFYTSAIKTDGTLWTWGRNSYGQLGRGSNPTSRITPVTTFSGGTNWSDTATGAPEELYTISNSGLNGFIAIKTDGTLWGWGANTHGQLGTNDTTLRSTPVTTILGGTDWKQLARGSDVTVSGSHIAAVKTDGTLWLWGRNNRGQLGNNNILGATTPVTTFSGGTNWKQVSCGGYHTSAIKTDGTLWTWGNNFYGQLGLNYSFGFTTQPSTTPVTTFAGGTNWKQVSCGGYYTAAIKTDGTLWVWGRNDLSQLGIESTVARTTPVTTFVGGTNWKQVACAYGHTAAIKTDGTLWTWGRNNLGQLGRSLSSSIRLTPVTTFSGGTNWSDTATGAPEELYTISTANSTSAAIKTDGTLWLWGQSTKIGSASGNRSTPVTTFAGGTNWKQVAFGNSHATAIKTDGTLWTWGLNTYGPLGDNTTVTRQNPVTTFAGGTEWKQVSCGYDHTAAIKTDGTLWIWGRNYYGQVGDNTVTNRVTPVTTFAGGTDWKHVSCSRRGTAAIKTDGTLWVWGDNFYGQMGDNTSTSRSTPVTTFAGGTNWKQVSGGSSHTAAIKTDGTLWTWGDNPDGQLGDNSSGIRTSTPITTFSGGTNWKQVSCGGLVTAAIKTDGTLWIWGSAIRGRLGNNEGLNDVLTPITTFAGGTNWTQVFSENADIASPNILALKTDGTLWGWGSNSYQSLAINWINTDVLPTTTFAGGTDWKQVACGRDHTAAIKTEGTLWTWGRNSYGQLGINDDSILSNTRDTPVTTFSGGTDWTQVVCGSQTTAAVKTDGTLWTWGTNTSQGLGINWADTNIFPGQTLSGGTDWTEVSCGNDHLIALKNDKTLWTWGRNTYGQLGRNNVSQSTTPVTTFVGGTTWKKIAAGGDHSLAIKTDGTLWVWGRNSYGRLGINNTSNRSIPVTTISGGTNWKQVGGGEQFTTGIIYIEQY